MNIKSRDLYMLKRRKKRITHKEIASIIGVTQSSISKYETGVINFKKSTQLAYEQYIDNH